MRVKENFLLVDIHVLRLYLNLLELIVTCCLLLIIFIDLYHMIDLLVACSLKNLMNHCKV